MAAGFLTVYVVHILLQNPISVLITFREETLLNIFISESPSFTAHVVFALGFIFQEEVVVVARV